MATRQAKQSHFLLLMGWPDKCSQKIRPRKFGVDVGRHIDRLQLQQEVRFILMRIPGALVRGEQLHDANLVEALGHFDGVIGRFLVALFPFLWNLTHTQT